MWVGCLVVDCVDVIPERGNIFIWGIHSCAVNFCFFREGNFEGKIVIVILYVGDFYAIAFFLTRIKIPLFIGGVPWKLYFDSVG